MFIPTYMSRDMCSRTIIMSSLPLQGFPEEWAKVTGEGANEKSTSVSCELSHLKKRELYKINNNKQGSPKSLRNLPIKIRPSAFFLISGLEKGNNGSNDYSKINNQFG